MSGRRVVDASVYSVEFKPRGTGRRVVGFLTLVCLAATAYFGWQAYEERTPISYGITATLGALTIVLWAAWAASPVSHLHVHGGILEVQRAGRTERFDLTSHYTIIRTQGKPRSNRWRQGSSSVAAVRSLGGSAKRPGGSGQAPSGRPVTASTTKPSRMKLMSE